MSRNHSKLVLHYIVMSLRFSKLFLVKKGRLDKVQRWLRSLATERREEAIGTFRHEDVIREAVALFEGADGEHYLVGLSEVGPNWQPADSRISINREHTAFKKACLEPISDVGTVLLDLEGDIRT